MAENKKEVMDKARKLKVELEVRRLAVKSSLKDIAVLIECENVGDYSEVYKTTMYIKHGAEYCQALEILNEWRNK